MAVGRVQCSASLIEPAHKTRQYLRAGAKVKKFSGPTYRQLFWLPIWLFKTDQTCPECSYVSGSIETG